MARRKGKKGDYLATDDYTGFTEYASRLKLDYWGSLTRKPMLRNLQEISSPLNDPAPVINFRGPNYEATPVCVAEVAPFFVGNTNVRTNMNNAAFPALDLEPAIPDMIVGCNFVVYPG